jgi:hypothetical protein
MHFMFGLETRFDGTVPFFFFDNEGYHRRMCTCFE